MPAISSATQRSILLVEEYDALAVAIESAVRKFAPDHKTHVARSLPEACALAYAHKPELIIVDFDPPHPGAIAFFEELKSALPDSRALVIAAGVASDFIAERGSSRALQFLDKPFELVDFGAAVQALLGPWMDTGTPRGTLRDLAVSDAASLLCLGAASAMLQVHTADDRNGQLHVQKGQIVHAISSNAEGERALVEMLPWRNARFSEGVLPLAILKTIRGPWGATLVDALREAKKRAPTLGKTVPAKDLAPPPAPPAQKTGAKILIIDDTEMLLIFVEDSLAVTEPNFQITTALTGLHGIKEAERIIPDLILLDYVLPDIKGDEVCRRLASNERTHQIPVIMMSGHVPEMTAAAEKLPNVVATLAKPFLSEAMVAVVRQTLKEGPRRKTESVAAAQKKSAEFLLQKEKIVNAGAKGSPSTGASHAEAPRSPPPDPGPAKAAPRGLTVSPPLSFSSVPGTPEIMRPPISTERHATSVVSQSSARTPSMLGPNEVLLDLPLDVVSMQFDSCLQIDSIRARPASLTVAIQIPALAARTALPLASGFRLGPIDLDAHGRLSIVRLIPTTQPFQVVKTRTAFEIGGVAIVPANERERLQLLFVATPNMTMQLFAPLELESVEFSATLDVKQLVLRCRGKAVRVSLNSQSSLTQTGASFQTMAVTLDEAKQIRELTLAPAS